MALNGRFLSLAGEIEERVDHEVAELLTGHEDGTLEIFYDRSATLDSLSHMIHAPKKEPIRGRVRAVLARDVRLDLKQLSLVVSKCPNLTSLFLEKNELRADGGSGLASVLEGEGSALCSLCLKRNYIGDRGAASLGEAMTRWKNRALRCLYLGYCNIGTQGARSLCEAASVVPLALTLVKLDLSANFLKEEGATAIAKMLGTNRRIKTLMLGGNALEDAGIKALAEAIGAGSIVETVSLSQNHVSDAGARHLSEALKKNPALTTLLLASNAIEAQGAMHLAQAMRHNTRLKVLDLNNNRLGDRGAEHCANVLRLASHLQALHLADNVIGDAGAKFLAPALAANSTLGMLDLDVNPITQSGQDALVGAVRQRKDVGILRVGNHAYGALLKIRMEQEALREKQKKLDEEKAKALEESIKVVAEQKAPTAPSIKPRIEKKQQEGPKPEGTIGALFKKWSVQGSGQKGSRQAKSMDYKEYLEMLQSMGIIPGKLSKAAAQEVFRQANRAGTVSDGDNLELDWLEFKYAMHRISERIHVPEEELASMDCAHRTDSSDKPGHDVPGRPRSSGGGPGGGLLKGADLHCVFTHFAASDGQSKKRAHSLDGKEFMLLLTYLQFLPDRVTKTFAMDVFQKAKKHSMDSSELDWTACQWAFQKIAKQINIPYENLHTVRKAPH